MGGGARTSRRSGVRSKAFATTIVALALGALLAGCGGERSADPIGAVASSLSPASMRKADCVDWNAAGADERLAAVQGFAAYFGESLPEGSPAQTLPDDDAYELLERTCSSERARDFFLWGVYMQASGFTGYGDAYEAALGRLEGTVR